MSTFIHNGMYEQSPMCMHVASHGPAGTSLEKLQTVRESLDCFRLDEASWLDEKTHV